MDSMRSLNTSLPSAKRRPQPPAQLLQAFKTAALQVTNLYKAAATDREQAHEEGYQAALEDMLSFLDAENLGVGDGEGWRVRQWVTEKLQEGMANNAQGLDSDDDQPADDDKRARSSSPILQRRTNPEDTSAATVATAPAAPPAPTPASISPEPAPERPAFDATLPKSDFTFRSTRPLPAPQHDQEMDGDAAELTDGSTNTNTPMQINLFPRSHHHHGRAINHRSGGGGHRSNHARNNSHRDSAAAAATAAAVAQIGTNIGQGAGLKRRAPLGDFFDITGLGNGKDMFGGGGKRGRFT